MTSISKKLGLSFVGMIFVTGCGSSGGGDSSGEVLPTPTPKPAVVTPAETPAPQRTSVENANYRFSVDDLKAIKGKSSSTGDFVMWSYTVKVDGKDVSTSSEVNFEVVQKALTSLGWYTKPEKIELEISAYINEKNGKVLLATNQATDGIEPKYHANAQGCGEIRRSLNVTPAVLIEKNGKYEIPFNFEMCDLTNKKKVSLKDEVVLKTESVVARTALKCQTRMESLNGDELVWANDRGFCEVGLNKSATIVSDSANMQKYENGLTYPSHLQSKSTSIAMPGYVVNFDKSSPISTRFSMSKDQFPRKHSNAGSYWLPLEDCDMSEFILPYMLESSTQKSEAKIHFEKRLSTEGKLTWEAFDQKTLPSHAQLKEAKENLVKFNLYCKWKSYNFLQTESIAK